MTVQDTTPSVTFVGTGAQLSFPFTFRVDDVAWLSVDYLVNFDQFTINADQDNNPGGTVEYTIAPPLAQELTVIRDTANTQELDYTRYDPFDSESHEDALDKLTMQIQDLQYLITSTLTQDFDNLGNVDFTGKSDGSLIYWDAGAMLWQDTGVELLFDPGVSFDTNVLVQVQAGADFTSSLRMRSINEIEFFDATNITSSRIFQSVPDLIIDGQGVTGGVTFTGYSDTRPVWIATELALVTDIPVVISDHTLLTNIGVNTHAQIDTHIADSTIHFTEGSIDHTAISNVGINSHGIIDSHIANAAIHFTVGSIDHTVITNIGVNSHAQIDAAITLNAANQVITDAHIADLSIHYADAPADAQDYVRNNNAWVVASAGVTDHFLLTNIGVNTHVQIDSHIASVANPHVVTLQQAFTAGNTMDSTVAGVAIPDMTEAQRDAIGVPASGPGTLLFNTDTGQVNQWNGAAWSIPGAGLTTLQGAYDNDPTGAQILLDATPNPFTVQAQVSGTVVSWLDVGGQSILEVTADPDVITAQAGVQINDAFTNSGAAASLQFNDTFTTGGNYVGGGIQSLGTVTYDSAVFIWALLQESKTYIANAGPGFAAFTLFNALATIQNGGNFNLVQSITLNVGVGHARTTAGTSTVTANTGMNFAPAIRSLVAGAVMTRTNCDAVTVAPTFNTVAGSTVNMGTMRGMRFVQPAVQIFGSAAGTENMTAYYGIDFPNMTFGGASANYSVIRSLLNSGTNKRFLDHTGTAESRLGGPLNFPNDFPNGIIRMGLSTDFSMGYLASNELFMQIATPAVTQWRYSSPSANRLLMSTSIPATAELNFNCLKFSLGAQAGSVGNQKGVFVAGAETVTIGGEFSQFLLTQAANDTIDAALSLYAGWTINAPSPVIGTGSLTDGVALNIGGNPSTASVNRVGLRIISNPSGGSGVNAALWVTAGATQLDGNIGFFGTPAIPQQVAVPVSAAGIHAALVAYGLIT